MFSTWSDSWYGRCLFSSVSRRLISPASPSFDTSSRTMPMPP